MEVLNPTARDFLTDGSGVYMNKKGRKLFNKHGRSDPLDQQLYQYLTQRISEGTLSGGDRLVEAELQKVFKVSRTPIREALRILTSRGLLETVPGKGASIRQVSFEDIKEIYPILANLEGLAANMATDHISPETLTEMLSYLEQMESLNKAGRNDLISNTIIAFMGSISRAATTSISSRLSWT